MSRKKPMRDCAVCGALFATIAEHQDHVMQAHDLGIGRRDRCRRRPLSCWRCASEVQIEQTTRCSCGFDFADKGITAGPR